MGILTGDMQRVVREQKLGFWATVSDDGSPNLSPKGSTDVWDDDHLYCCDICSPQTVANIRRGSLVEVNVVDPFLRKGYRFKGAAIVHDPGSAGFDEGVERMRTAGSKLADRAQSIIVLEVAHTEPVISPAYDDGTVTEADVLALHQARYAALHAQGNR
jgi:predicted pyridoxine 5'-phosphate oxidase superfamily flavin-nucleotide-binding protein